MWSRTVRTNNDGSAMWCWFRKYRLNVHTVAANDDDNAIYIKYNIHGKMYHVSVQYSTVQCCTVHILVVDYAVRERNAATEQVKY